MSLGVREQPATGLVDRRAEPDAGEDVEQRAVVRHRVPHVVRRHDRHAMRVGEVGESPRQPRAGPVAMMMHVDGEAVGEDALQPIEPCRRRRGIDERAVVAAGETEEPVRVRFDLLPSDASLALLSTECAGGEQPAEVRVAGAILDEQMQHARALDDDVGPDDRAYAGLLRGLEEARRAGEAVAVRERDRVVPERRGAGDEVLGQGRAVEEGEGAPATQLDVVTRHGRLAARRVA
jgi:hypothetical protein